jgi:hypothetical protein
MPSGYELTGNGYVISTNFLTCINIDKRDELLAASSPAIETGSFICIILSPISSECLKRWHVSKFLPYYQVIPH